MAMVSYLRLCLLAIFCTLFFSFSFLATSVRIWAAIWFDWIPSLSCQHASIYCINISVNGLWWKAELLNPVTQQDVRSKKYLIDLPCFVSLYLSGEACTVMLYFTVHLLALTVTSSIKTNETVPQAAKDETQATWVIGEGLCFELWTRPDPDLFILHSFHIPAKQIYETPRNQTFLSFYDVK